MAKDPIRPTDDEARALARRLINEAHSASLGIVFEGRPYVSRILLTTGKDGVPLTLVSDLSFHTQGLRSGPTPSLLIGDPGDKGDPLTHPRLTLGVKPAFLERPSQAYSSARDQILKSRPKTKLYIDFGDFRIVRLDPVDALLNGGFGRAYRLSANDLSYNP